MKRKRKTKPLNDNANETKHLNDNVELLNNGNINDIPDNLLDLSLQYLNLKEITTLRQVNKRFKQVVDKNNDFWRKINDSVWKYLKFTDEDLKISNAKNTEKEKFVFLLGKYKEELQGSDPRKNSRTHLSHLRYAYLMIIILTGSENELKDFLSKYFMDKAINYGDVFSPLIAAAMTGGRKKIELLFEYTGISEEYIEPAIKYLIEHAGSIDAIQFLINKLQNKDVLKIFLSLIIKNLNFPLICWLVSEQSININDLLEDNDQLILIAKMAIENNSLVILDACLNKIESIADDETTLKEKDIIKQRFFENILTILEVKHIKNFSLIEIMLDYQSLEKRIYLFLLTKSIEINNFNFAEKVIACARKNSHSYLYSCMTTAISMRCQKIIEFLIKTYSYAPFIKTFEDKTDIISLLITHNFVDIATEFIFNGAFEKDKLYLSLHLAVRKGYAGFAEILLENGADIRKINQFQETILHVAAASNQPRLAKILLERDKELINLPNMYGYNALHIAIMQGNFELVKLLESYGADLDAIANDNKDSWCLAVENNHWEIATFILKKTHFINGQNYSSLGTAINYGKEDVVELLLKRGANVNKSSTAKGTMLHLAAANGNLNIVKLLITYGADINCFNQQNLDPLFFAIEKNNLAVAEYLIKNGADIKRPISGYNNFYELAKAKSNWDILNFLIEKHESFILNDPRPHPYLQFLYAAQKGNLEHLKDIQYNLNLQLDRSDTNFSLQITTFYGENIFTKAIKFGQINIIKYWLENNIPVNFFDSIELAIKNQQWRVVEFFIETEIKNISIDNLIKINILITEYGDKGNNAILAIREMIDKLLFAIPSKAIPIQNSELSESLLLNAEEKLNPDGAPPTKKQKIGDNRYATWFHDEKSLHQDAEGKNNTNSNYTSYTQI